MAKSMIIEELGEIVRIQTQKGSAVSFVKNSLRVFREI